MRSGALVLPTLLFGLAGWLLWQSEVQRAEDRVLFLADAVREHLSKVIETHELMLDRVGDQLDHRDWADIEADPAVHTRMAAIASRHPQTALILAVDATGRWRASSSGHPVPEGWSADREHFLTLRSGYPGTLVSSVFQGRITGQSVIAIARRLENRDGGFAGTIQASLHLRYLERVWRQLADRPGDTVTLLRHDGVVIARMPAEGIGRSYTWPGLDPAEEPARTVIWSTSQIDGQNRVFGYSDLASHPIRVSVSMARGGVVQGWLGAVLLIVPFWLLAVLISLGAVVGTSRLLRREKEALFQEKAARESWRQAAVALENEGKARRAAEDALRHAQKIEAVGRLTGGVAHDLNNVLQAIAANLGALEAGIEQYLRPSLQAAVDAVARGAWLTQQLTAFARKQTLSPKVVAAGPLFSGLHDLLQRTMGGQVRVELHSAPDTWPVYVDPTQLELALLNLAMNGRDAMPVGGTLQLTARNCAAGASLDTLDGPLPPGDYVCLSVQDTGQGMPADLIAKAVEPFFTTKEAGKGTGLGLSMVHGFAAQSGGGLAIESIPDRGTTVRIYLPRSFQTVAAEKSQDRWRPAPAVGSAERVLLVDDDALVRMGLAAILREAGYEVVEAESAAAALALQERKASFDAVITDFAMPDMNGFELLAALGACASGPVTIMLTGYTGNAVSMDFDAVADLVLSKPVTPRKLITALQALLTSPPSDARRVEDDPAQTCSAAEAHLGMDAHAKDLTPAEGRGRTVRSARHVLPGIVQQ